VKNARMWWMNLMAVAMVMDVSEAGCMTMHHYMRKPGMRETQYCYGGALKKKSIYFLIVVSTGVIYIYMYIIISHMTFRINTQTTYHAHSNNRIIQYCVPFNYLSEPFKGFLFK
jgi:hypothetical protein